MMVKLWRTWILTSILWLLLLLDTAELQDIVFPKSKDGKDGKDEKGMAASRHLFIYLFGLLISIYREGEGL